MSKRRFMARKSALASVFVCGVIAAAAVAGDLSKYRSFQFGTDLSTVATQVGASVSQAKVLHSRLALIPGVGVAPPRARGRPARKYQRTP